MSKKIELSRRRVLTMLVIIGLASAAVGVGTVAFFTDQEDSTSNTINAGTLDLSGATDAQITAGNAVPGDTFSGTVTTNYAGSVDAEVDVDFTIAEPTTENSEPASPNTELTAIQFARELEVTSAQIDIGSGAHTADLLTAGSVTDTNTNGYVDLADLTNQSVIDNATGAPVADGETVDVSLNLTFVTSAGNDAQADGVNITISQIAQQPSAD